MKHTFLLTCITPRKTWAQTGNLDIMLCVHENINIKFKVSFNLVWKGNVIQNDNGLCFLRASHWQPPLFFGLESGHERTSICTHHLPPETCPGSVGPLHFPGVSHQGTVTSCTRVISPTGSALSCHRFDWHSAFPPLLKMLETCGLVFHVVPDTV